MTTAHRDLASPDYWERSLARSLHRRALVPRARREQNRRKRMAAVVASATMAGPATPLAFAAAPRDLAAEVASETPSQRAIEVRDGGLPLMLGSQGALVAQVQKALGIPADGIFGPQTDSAVRGYQIPRRDAGRRDRRAGHLGGAVRGPRRGRLERSAAGQAAPRARASPGGAAPRCAGKRPHPGAVRRQWRRAGAGRAAGGGSRERRRGRGVAGRRADRPAGGRRGPRALHARAHGMRLVHTELAGERHGHVRVRTALGAQPRRLGHRRAHRHGNPRRRLRHGDDRRHPERLRQHRLHHPQQPASPRATRTCRASR